MLEAGEPVAGSMAHSAAEVLFDRASSRLSLPPLEGGLVRAATAAATLSLAD